MSQSSTNSLQILWTPIDLKLQNKFLDDRSNTKNVPSSVSVRSIKSLLLNETIALPTSAGDIFRAIFIFLFSGQFPSPHITPKSIVMGSLALNGCNLEDLFVWLDRWRSLPEVIA